jgi:hypothetical protein
MILKKAAKILILSMAIQASGAINATEPSQTLEAKAKKKIEKCNENLKSSNFKCTAGCGLAYKACLDEGGILASKEVEKLYGILIEKPDCKALSEKLKDQVDGLIVKLENDWTDAAYFSEFSLISYFYLYDSLLLIQKKCGRG